MPSSTAAVWHRTDSPPHPVHPAARIKPVRPQVSRGVRENSSVMPTAMAAIAKDDNLVILNFSGTDGDFQFATEEERAENVNIGISVQKGNTQLADAIDTVLSVLNEEQFNALMDQAIAIQPEV